MGRGNKYFKVGGLRRGRVAVVGVRDCDWPKDEPLTHGDGERGWRFAGKGRAFPSPEAGEAGRGQMGHRHLISTV